MNRSAPPLQLLATATTTSTAAMSSRSSYRGGRKQWGRGFAERPYHSGRGQGFVTGDSHLRSVQDANLRFRREGDGGFNSQPPPYNQSQQLRQPRPYNHYQQFRQPPPFYQNQSANQNQNHHFRQAPPFDHSQGFRPPQQFRPRPSKPLDYRNWEYSKTSPPSDSERFVVLSYNILADYLAIEHRSKLYFHIPQHMMDWEWRKRNIIFELGLWSADIMCFQEVDRFQDLEEELKLRGYSGVWKMRTGSASDGCALFWRTSRFKLLFEESIEFSKLGLRDNVAQICVLEQSMNQDYTASTASLPTSSTSSNKVVVCNIHVLYNPKRGEIKLGQVRTLLDRAYAVSKIWNDAPVILCGDFNCIPKSPLYNFISERKLDLSGTDRDKVSGQASAEIQPRRPFNSGYNSNFRIVSKDSSVQTPLVVDNEVGDSLSEKKITSDISHIVGQCRSVDSTLCFEETKETHGEVAFTVDQLNEGSHESTPPVTSHHEDAYPGRNEMEQREKTNSVDLSTQGLLCDNIQSNFHTEKERTNFGSLPLSFEVSQETSEYLSTKSIFNDENSGLSTPDQANVSAATTSTCSEEDNKQEDTPLELNSLLTGDGMIGEDQNTFLSALHADFNQTINSDLDQSSKEIASDPNHSLLQSPSDDLMTDSSLILDSEIVDVEKAAYDPSLWTPMEIATATGNVDCICLEHPLKLKSTYAEVEDCSDTRDPNGEPIVTSYNRRFFGTVDYIWCSEGLQTVKVLAPIPKHAMQWTSGFPTKKWGSDHIALVSELAFTKDARDNNIVGQ